MSPVRIYKAEVSPGILRGGLVRSKCLVYKSLDNRLRVRAFLRPRTDKPADHALFGRPPAAERCVLDAELLAMLVAQVLRECRRIPVVDVARLPVGRWR